MPAKEAEGAWFHIIAWLYRLKKVRQIQGIDLEKSRYEFSQLIEINIKQETEHTVENYQVVQESIM